MSDRDELREAFIARGGHDHDLASEVAASLRPRMRRARLLRRAVAASVTFSMAVVVGFAIASVDTGTPPPDTVQADGAQQAVDSEAAGESPRPTASEAPADSSDDPEGATRPVPLDEEADAVDDDDVEPSTEPPAEPSPTAEAAAEPVVTAPPAADPPEEPEPEPTKSAEPAPTEPVSADPEPVIQVVKTSVGDITVMYTPDAIVSVEAAPITGFTSETVKMERTEVKVIFTAEDPDDETVVEVEVHLQDGELTDDISPDDAAL